MAGGDDRGREAVYAAEEVAFGGTTFGARVPMSQLERRVRMIVEGDWWREAGGPAVDVFTARASACSSSARFDGSRAIVRVAAGQVDEATVAHELAHVLAGVHHGHDELFRAAHLDVVALLASAAVASRLGEAYAAFGLVVGTRTWPAPTRWTGDTFVVVP